jgi:hypothetical protein
MSHWDSEITSTLIDVQGFLKRGDFTAAGDPMPQFGSGLARCDFYRGGLLCIAYSAPTLQAGIGKNGIMIFLRIRNTKQLKPRHLV